MTTAPAQPVFTLRNPADIVAAIPYMLGYHPSDVLVVVGVCGPPARAHLTLRCDLTTDVTERVTEFASQVATTLGEHDCDGALVVAYGPTERATSCVDALRAALPANGVAVREALRVTSGRYWSYLCESPDCCPADGVPVDSIRSPVSATAVFHGLSAWRDSAQLRRYLAPVEGGATERVREATVAAERRGAQLRGHHVTSVRDPFGAAFRIEGVRVVRDSVVAARRGAIPDDPHELAWLGVLLTCVRVRDEAWARISTATTAAGTGPGEPNPDVRLWRQVLRNVESSYAAAPGCLVAVAAWHAGDRALAEAAVNEVTLLRADYSMARLVREALRTGLPPDDCAPTPEWLERVWPVAGP